jgi:hypothetical protein
MERFVRIFLILCILGASLEGAADIGAAADPSHDADCVADVTETDRSDDSCDTRGGEEDCTVCTPFCHCSLHGGGLSADSSAKSASPTPDSTPLHVALPYVSFLQPPFLPPPIL